MTLDQWFAEYASLKKLNQDISKTAQKAARKSPDLTVEKQILKDVAEGNF